MLNFKRLIVLHKHIQYLQKKVGVKDLFLVWGCVRDLLLGLVNDPTDIDVTMTGKPKDIYNWILKNDISIFKTDKFWTITIIPKTKSEIESISKLTTYKSNKTKNLKKPIKYVYEITPLRTEWDYEDFRHPWEINWTNDIVLDSNRRDFTINCIYYYSIKSENIPLPEKSTQIKDIERFLKIYEKESAIFLKDSHTLIIRTHKLINELFPKSRLSLNKIKKLLQKINSYHFNQEIWNSDNKDKSKRKSSIHNPLSEDNGLIQIILDPHDWIQDLTTKTINAVWEPDKRFSEDALRVIRALRIPNILNQKLDKKILEHETWTYISWSRKLFDYWTETWRSMQKNFYLVQFVAKERIRDEIIKVFSHNNPFWFIGLMDELNILKFIFPWLYECKHVDQPIRYHPFDVYTHTMMCLWHLQNMNPSYIVKLWIIYHDIGKPIQYAYTRVWLTPEERKKAHWSYIHHSNLWADMAVKELKSAWYSNKEIDEIYFYVKFHMIPWEILWGNPDNYAKKLNKLMSEYWYDKVNNLLDICISDRCWQYNPMQNPEIQWFHEMKILLKKIYDSQWEFSQKNMKIDGNDIMKKFDLKPWPIVGVLLTKAFDWVLDDVETRNKKSEILKYLDKNYIKK